MRKGRRERVGRRGINKKERESERETPSSCHSL